MPAENHSTDVATVHRIVHNEAMQLAANENRRFLALLTQLGSADWQKATDCPRWTVRDVAVHVTASAEAQASPVEFLRQLWQGRRLISESGGHHWVDGLNEAQLRERGQLTPDDIPARWERASAAALKARQRMPVLVRKLPVLPLGSVGGVDLGWQPLGYLFGIGFTRDVWMHRIDVCRAAGMPMEPTRDHDGRIVADIIAEWATLHSEPFALRLTGPAGGTFTRKGGSDGGWLEIDALECCRILSGRGQAHGVLRHPLPL
jgi:uncharacterized protein (TIGR03083 family)